MQPALKKTAIVIQRMLLNDIKRTAIETIFDSKCRHPCSHAHILAELTQLHMQARFSPETLVATIALLIRFRHHIPLTTHNFARIVQVSVALSAKSVDDVCAGLEAFSYRETMADLIEMERLFCKIIDYRINIDCDSYNASYRLYAGIADAM